MFPNGSSSRLTGASRPSPSRSVHAVNAIAQFGAAFGLVSCLEFRNRIRNAMESDHRIFRNEVPGEAGFEREFHFLAEKEAGIGNAVAHLDKVFDGEIGDGVGVHFACAFELRKYSWPIRGRGDQATQEDGAVFKGAVQALSEKGTMACAASPSSSALSHDARAST